MSLTWHGRRIVRLQLPDNQIEFVQSGQWVGHTRYGDQWGTTRQRQNALCLFPNAKITGISNKVFWTLKGVTGDLVDNEIQEKAEKEGWQQP